MKIFHSLNQVKKSLQFVLLLIVFLLNFGMGGSSKVEATTCFTLTLITKGGGAITPNISPDCISGALVQYSSGKMPQLTAFSNSAYHFGSWSGDLTGTTNPQSITMLANHSVTANFPPNNDNNARLIDNVTYVDSVDTRAATQPVSDPDAIPCSTASGSEVLNSGLHTVWYTYTPPANQSIALDTLGSDYDTFIAVWSGTPGGTWVACNDDTSEAVQSELSFSASGGTTYYIEIAVGNGLDGGTPPLPTTFGGLQFHAYITNTNILINGNLNGKYFLSPNSSLRRSYVGINNGPVNITNTTPVQVIGAERVIYNVNGANTSFSEMMGLPASQLNTIYWLPWYNNVDLDTQLRFGNVSGSTATVHVFIGGTEVTPLSGITLAVGASTRVSYTAVNNGPVKIVSDQNIVAAERVIYKINGVNTSFSEMMALPASQLNIIYWLPWYNNVDLDTQLRLGNVSGSTATVHVFIGGTEVTPVSGITLAVGASTRVSYTAVNNGPVKIVSDQNIVAAERVIYKINGANTSFSEMMALPNSLLDTSYWLPWYNNVDLDTQLRFGMP